MGKKEYMKEYHLKNRLKINKYHLDKWDSISKEQQKEISTQSNNKKTKEQIKTHNQNSIKSGYRKRYHKMKMKTDPSYKLLAVLRFRFYDAIKNNKTHPITKLVGCTIKELYSYLEEQFKPEMSWENYGEIWEIDHIKPCASFDLTKEEEQKECFHYSNLQPLFKTTQIAESFGYKDEIGNRNKKDKYENNNI